MSKVFFVLSKVLGGCCFAFGTPILAKEWIVNKYAGKESLEGKTIIVTGANSGIGYKLSSELAKRNAKVIMACSDENACIFKRREIVKDTGNGQVYCSKLDLASLDSIRAFVNRMNEKVGKIDVLVNNASVMRLKKRTLTSDGFEQQLGVNHLGHFLLTNLLLDNLKSGEKVSKIINVTCKDYLNGTIKFDDINNVQGYDPSKAYKQSKMATVLFTDELSRLTKDSNVNVFTVMPLRSRTAIKRHLDYSAHQAAEGYLLPIIDSKYESKEHNGKFFYNGKESSVKLPEDSLIQAKKLWLISEKWTRLK